MFTSAHVDDVPPFLQVVGAAVLVFQAIGVPPDVMAYDGLEALAHGIVLNGGADDL